MLEGSQSQAKAEISKVVVKMGGVCLYKILSKRIEGSIVRRYWWLYFVIITCATFLIGGGILLILENHHSFTPQKPAVQLSISAAPHNERKMIQKYNQAAIKQDWTTVYDLTSQSVTAGYTEAQFAQMMTQQVQNIGTISSISATSNPQVTINSANTIYFTISEKVTINKNGMTQSKSMIVVFILENGSWKFWFSKME